jgi:hypothetical protein
MFMQRKLKDTTPIARPNSEAIRSHLGEALSCHCQCGICHDYTCWLLSGWVSGAFLFRNTLDCDNETALVVTFKTWILTSIIMVALSLGTDLCFFQQSGLTKADADYIFDSLSVLITWKFLVNAMLGYGRK